MKVKYSWIPFIPIAVIMTLFKVANLIFADEYGKFLGLSPVNVSYISIALALLIFVVCIVFNIADKKTAPVYAADRNIPAAIFALLSGAFVLASSAIVAIDNSQSSDYFMIYVVNILFALIAAIAFVYLAKVHFTGDSMISYATYIYVFIPLWACSELISCFFESTRVSVSSTDMTEIFCYIFLTLYTLSLSMIVSRIQGRNPVKAATLYGFPAAALSAMQGCYLFISAFKGGYNGTYMLKGLMFIFVAVYIVCFFAELTKGLVDKTEIEMIEEVPEYDPINSVITDGYDDYIIDEPSAKKDGEQAEKADSAEEDADDDKNNDLEMNQDIIISVSDEDEKNPIIYSEQAVKQEVDDFYFEVAEPVDEKNIEIIEKTQPVIPVSAVKTEEPEEIDSEEIVQKKLVFESDGNGTHQVSEGEQNETTDETDKKPLDRMDEIDKLIAELEKENI